MKAQYTLSVDDLRLLKKRIPNPCLTCAVGPASTYQCKSGHLCDRRAVYDDYVAQVKREGMEELLPLLLEVDSLMRKRDEINNELTCLASKIGDKFGNAVLTSIGRNIYLDKF